MARSAVIHVRLSESAQEFLATTLDLLQEIADADEALVTDGILEAAARVLAVVEEHPGEL